MRAHVTMVAGVSDTNVRTFLLQMADWDSPVSKSASNSWRKTGQGNHAESLVSPKICELHWALIHWADEPHAICKSRLCLDTRNSMNFGKSSGAWSDRHQG